MEKGGCRSAHYKPDSYLICLHLASVYGKLKNIQKKLFVDILWTWNSKFSHAYSVSTNKENERRHFLLNDLPLYA